MSDDWQKRQLVDAQIKFAETETRRLEAEKERLQVLAEIPRGKLRGPWQPAQFITLWLCQILTWGWLMMVFKKDVWPH